MAYVGCRRDKITHKLWRDRRGRQRWDAQIYLGRVAGKPKTVYRTFFSEAEALAWVQAHEKTRAPRSKKGSVAVADFITQWFALHREGLRPGTQHTYWTTLCKWVIDPREGVPVIGALPLAAIRPAALEALYQHMYATGVRAGVVALHRILSIAFKYAQQLGHTSENIAALADVPYTAPAPCLHTFSPDEVTAFLQAISGSRLPVFWHLALVSGLHVGELAALQWEDIDWVHCRLVVRNSLTRAGVGGVRLMALKAGTRTVALPHESLVLLGHEKSKAHSSFIFASGTGNPIDYHVLRRDFARILRKMNLGSHGEQPPKRRAGPRAAAPFIPAVSMTILRDTHIAMLLRQGIDPLAVGRHAGFSDPRQVFHLYRSAIPITKVSSSMLDQVFA